MNRFEKAAINVAVPYRSRRTPLFLPAQSQQSYLTPSEAKAMASAMASAAPHGALDYTQVDLNGAKLVDLMERAHNNPRNTKLLKFLNASNLFNSGYLADKTQLTGDSYYPASDKVVLPSGNPGALVRELGHAIDVNSFSNTPVKRLVSNIYSNVAPDVWREGAAWQKGRKALLEGGAKQNLDPKLVTRALEDAARIKPYGTGSNWGTALGAVGGLGAGLGLSYYAHKNDWPMSVPTYVFPIAGGFGGAALGKALGYLYGSKPAHSSDEARKKYMDEYVNTYAKVNNMSKTQARAILESMSKLKSKDSQNITKAASFGEAMGKQAFIAWGGGQVGLHPKGKGIGAEAGYTNLLGLVPIPTAGIDIGGPSRGFKAGVTPDTDTVVAPYIGFRWGHPRTSGITRNFPRGLGEVLYDKIRGRSYEDAFRQSYPDDEPKEAPKEEPKKKPTKRKDKAEPAAKAASFGEMMGKSAYEYNKALVGGLGGALAGGVGSLAYDLATQNKKNRLKRFLATLGAGGLAGAGVGFLHDKADQLLQAAADAAKVKPVVTVGPRGDASTAPTSVAPPAPIAAAPAAAAPEVAPSVTSNVEPASAPVAPSAQPARRGLLGLRRR